METLKAVLKTVLFPVCLAGVSLAMMLIPFADSIPLALAAGGENLGHVSRIQGAAFAQQGGELRPLALHALVQRQDVLKTGPGARLELTMLDETRLALGADTALALERYDLGRQQGPGAVLLRLGRGAVRVATGDLSALRGGPFEVATPLGIIGIQGTEFWGGFLSAGELSVLLLSGQGVYLKNDAGKTEIVKPLEGAVLRSLDVPPPAPALWSPDRRAAAFRTVEFD